MNKFNWMIFKFFILLFVVATLATIFNSAAIPISFAGGMVAQYMVEELLKESKKDND